MQLRSSLPSVLKVVVTGDIEGILTSRTSRKTLDQPFRLLLCQSRLKRKLSNFEVCPRHEGPPWLRVDDIGFWDVVMTSVVLKPIHSWLPPTIGWIFSSDTVHGGQT